MTKIFRLKKIRNLLIGEHFFTEKVDWYIYCLIITINSVFLNQEILYIPLIIPIYGLIIALISIFTYKISSKGKKAIFEKQSLLSSFIWHSGGLGIGSFYYLFYSSNGLVQNEELTYNLLNSIITGYLIIFILLAFFKPVDLPYSEYKDMKQVCFVIKRELSNDHRRLMYHVGTSFKVLCSKIVSISIILVMILSFFFITSLILSPVVFPLGAMLNINEDIFNDILNIYIEMFPFYILIIIILFILSFVSYISLDSFTIGLLNFSQGLTGEYKALTILPPIKYSLVDKMSKKFYHKKYWEPTIETSFFIIAIFIFIYTIIPLPGLISVIASIFLGLTIMVATWILEDLSVTLNKEQDPFIGFVKYIKLSKNSIQIASIYPVIKLITKSLVVDPIYIPILEIEMPFYRLITEFSWGGGALIMIISILNLFIWCYMRFLKSKYIEKVNNLHEKIIIETSVKYNKIKGIGN